MKKMIYLMLFLVIAGATAVYAGNLLNGLGRSCMNEEGYDEEGYDEEGYDGEDNYSEED